MRERSDEAARGRLSSGCLSVRCELWFFRSVRQVFQFAFVRQICFFDRLDGNLVFGFRNERHFAWFWKGVFRNFVQVGFLVGFLQQGVLLAWFAFQIKPSPIYLSHGIVIVDVSCVASLCGIAFGVVHTVVVIVVRIADCWFVVISSHVITSLWLITPTRIVLARPIGRGAEGF